MDGAKSGNRKAKKKKKKKKKKTAMKTLKSKTTSLVIYCEN